LTFIFEFCPKFIQIIFPQNLRINRPRQQDQNQDFDRPIDEFIIKDFFHLGKFAVKVTAIFNFTKKE